MEDILEGLFDDLERRRQRARSSCRATRHRQDDRRRLPAQAAPGHRARRRADDRGDGDSCSPTSSPKRTASSCSRLRLGLVVPQQSLRHRSKRCFARRLASSTTMVLTPFEVGKSDREVRPAGRRRDAPAQPPCQPGHRARRTRASERSTRSCSEPTPITTQARLDPAQSTHQIFLLDSEQSVRPADLPQGRCRRNIVETRRRGCDRTTDSSPRCACRAARTTSSYRHARILRDEPPRA